MKSNKNTTNKFDLSVIIVSFSTAKILVNCLESILKHTFGIKFEIIVIDNASKDSSVQLVKELSKNNPINLIANRKNVGFGLANNQGIEIAKGKYILFLNSDTTIQDNLLKEMFEWLEQHEDVGISSCALKNKDGSLQGTGGYFPTLLRVFSWMTIQDLPLVDKFIKPFHPMKEKSFSDGRDFYSEKREIDWVTGAFLLTRRQILKEIGYFDKDYFMYMEEVDLCYRIKKAGWKVMYLPKWRIIHLGGASATREFSVINEFKSLKIFYQKHFPSWQYPLLRFLLKTGAVLRMLLFSITGGAGSAKIYAKAFKVA